MKRLLSALTLSLLVWACSGSDSSTAGATSETTNGFALRIADSNQQPLARARVSLYSKTSLFKLDSAIADESGMAYVNAPAEDCYLEGIAGGDSSLMVWESFDTTRSEVSLQPSASVVILADSLDSGELPMALRGTPYSVLLVDGAYVFAHVPAGEYTLVHGEEQVAQVTFGAGDTTRIVLETRAVEDDSSATLPDTSEAKPDTLQLDSAGIFLFEDFEDGDSLNNLAKYYPNHGWYFSTMKDARWIRPSKGESFSSSLDSSFAQGRYLSAHFNAGDSGMVILGSHLGSDSNAFDMSSLTAVRVTYRSNGNFSVALEHVKEVADNTFNKSLWNVDASEQWTEVVLKPGDEVVKPAVNQVEWSEISKEIALFSIFATEGSYLEVDKIVFEGVNFVYYTP